METSKMNYYFTGILIILLCLIAWVGPAYPGSTQTNTSGSNTAIEGGYTSTATTTYQSGSSSNSTTNSTTNSNTKSAPPSASSPSYNSMTQDVGGADFTLEFVVLFVVLLELDPDWYVVVAVDV